MIELRKVPHRLCPMAMLEETTDYLRETGIDVDPMLIIESDMLIPSLEYYHIFRGTEKIGFIVGFKVDDYWFAHRVFLNHKLYFLQVIDKITELKKEEGYTGIIAHPDAKTASLYKKHNIMKEI